MKKINASFKKNTYLKAAGIGLAVLGIGYVIVFVFVLQNKDVLENAFTQKNTLCQNSGCQDKLCTDKICFAIEYAITPQERQQGLMYRETMPELSGMLFVFERPGKLQFWMKNTLLVLDMIRLDDSYKITYIAKDVQPCPPALGDGCPAYGPTVAARYVLEVNGGMTSKYDIKVGDVMRKY